jgi:hypothetical protein
MIFGERLAGSVLAVLRAIGPDARAAAPKLIELLEVEPMPFIATTLVKIDADPLLVRSPLEHASIHGPPWMRREAAWALQQLAEAGKR